MCETVYRPAVEFTLAQSFLSDSQLQQIEQKTLLRIYAKCGYNRNTAKVILQGPRELGGAGFTPLRAAAGAVVHFLRYWRTPKEETGKLLRIVTAWYQYQLGVSFPVLEFPTKDTSYSQGRLIPAVKNYLAKIDAKIEVHNTFVSPSLRLNDSTITEIS